MGIDKNKYDLYDFKGKLIVEIDKNKYDLYDYTSYERVSKIMKEQFSDRIKSEPCFNHGKHDDIKDIYNTLNKDGWPDKVLLDECEVKLRQILIEENLKLFNLAREVEILKLRKEICSKLPKSSFNLKSRGSVINQLQEEIDSLDSRDVKMAILDNIFRLRCELREVLEMKGVSFKEEDEKIKEAILIHSIDCILEREFFNSEDFDGDK